MKKIILLSAVLGAFTVTSCKKARTCECNATISGLSYTKTYDLGKTKKKDAQTTCDSYKISYNWDACSLK